MKRCNNPIKAPFRILIVTILAVFFSHLNNVNAQNFYFKDKKQKASLNFELIKNLIIIPVYINGKGPYHFLLDTGVGPMIITEPSLIDTLGLKNFRSTKIYGLGKGEEIDAYLTQELSASVKDAQIDHIPTAILKQDVFNLSSYVGKKIYGILGFYFFDSFVVKISYTGKRLQFSSPLAKTRKKGYKMPLIIENKRPYITVDMVTPQQKQIVAKLIVDCGASHPLTMEALNGEAFPLPDSAIIANLGVGLSGPISGHVGRIPSITIGKFKFRDVTSGFPAFEAVAAQIGYNTRNGNIGAEFLRRFDTIYDYQDNAIYLKPNNSYRQKFDHDMSGIEVYTDVVYEKRYFIGRIEPGSPADKLGIKEQDEIISLDFKPIESYSLEQITNLFKSGNGNTVILEIVRNNKFIVKLLKLRRRV